MGGEIAGDRNEDVSALVGIVPYSELPDSCLIGLSWISSVSACTRSAITRHGRPNAIAENKAFTTAPDELYSEKLRATNVRLRERHLGRAGFLTFCQLGRLKFQ